MYKFIHIISALIRQFVLPNPYVNIIGNEAYADLFNIFIGGTILHICAYLLTRCGYVSGVDSPAAGSFGYLVSYCYVTILITVLGRFVSDVILFVIVFMILYIISCIIVRYIFDKGVAY